ncbi:uncharacterized protein LOC107481589 [Arachis duranensis]|uniref:Uncharacterized protein LOC107481589 n=1 Tax=Arachis duranensis TaxID=130453 RepID=A0A6P4CWA7_ARADU|nr:uncharacterized protein LOC107481589 [Arachis duranensis]XP_025691309.1 DNA polymerase delta subunit 4 [Arachis hypogaea]QHO03801.1 DNA polymerase delta subunit [Arachis hypogaea]
MASVSGNMKGFYRQKKSNTKSSKKASAKSSKKASAKSDAAQPTALVSHEDDYSAGEAMLRQFDMNMAYGPCAGMTRTARWERAQKLGLNPPQEIEKLLKSGKVQNESLWDGRI